MSATVKHDGKQEMEAVAMVLSSATVKELTDAGERMADRIGTIETADLGRLYADLCAVDGAFSMVQSITKQAFVLRLLTLSGRADFREVTREDMGKLLEPLTMTAIKERGVQEETARSTKSRMVNVLAEMQVQDRNARHLLKLASGNANLADMAKAYKADGPLTVKGVSKALAIGDSGATVKMLDALKAQESDLPRTPAQGKRKETDADKGKGKGKGKGEAQDVAFSGVRLDAARLAGVMAKVTKSADLLKATRAQVAQLVKLVGQSDADAVAVYLVFERFGEVTNGTLSERKS